MYAVFCYFDTNGYNLILSHPRTRGRRTHTSTDAERATDCDTQGHGSVSVPDEVIQKEGSDMDVDSGPPSLPESEISLYVPEPTPVPSSVGSEEGEGSQCLEVFGDDGDEVEAPSAPQPDADDESPVSPHCMDVLSEDGGKVEVPSGASVKDTPMSPQDESGPDGSLVKAEWASVASDDTIALSEDGEDQLEDLATWAREPNQESVTIRSEEMAVALDSARLPPTFRVLRYGDPEGASGDEMHFSDFHVSTRDEGGDDGNLE